MKIGYRGWIIKRINGKLTLCSPNQLYHWTPGENIALVNNQPMGIGEKTYHGFYALKSPESVFEYFCPSIAITEQIGIDVVGEVLLYGKVIEGEKGYRAEKAEVGTLLLPAIRYFEPSILEEVAKEYDTKFVVTSGHTRAVLARYRNMIARREIESTYGAKRCTAGGRAIAEIRKDEFLL